MVSFEELMKHFGVVTVFNACIFVPKTGYTGYMNCQNAGSDEAGLRPWDFQPAYEYIDTLKIANITQEGPTKTVTGGQYANALIKYGKTATIEMQDALGRASTLVRFFGAEYDGYTEYILTDADVGGNSVDINLPGVVNNDELLVRYNGNPMAVGQYVASDGVVSVNISGASAGDIIQITKAGSVLSITDRFPGAFAIEGDTFFVDQKTGEQKHVFVFIPQYLPDAILTLTQDAEGDAAVFDCNGTLNITTTKDKHDFVSKGFYQIRNESFFVDQRAAMNIAGANAAKQKGTWDGSTKKTVAPTIIGTTRKNGTYDNGVIEVVNPNVDSTYTLYKDGSAYSTNVQQSVGIDSVVFTLGTDSASVVAGTYTVKAEATGATISDASNAVTF